RRGRPRQEGDQGRPLRRDQHRGRGWPEPQGPGGRETPEEDRVGRDRHHRTERCADRTTGKQLAAEPSSSRRSGGGARGVRRSTPPPKGDDGTVLLSTDVAGRHAPEEEDAPAPRRPHPGARVPGPPPFLPPGAPQT